MVTEITAAPQVAEVPQGIRRMEDTTEAATQWEPMTQTVEDTAIPPPAVDAHFHLDRLLTDLHLPLVAPNALTTVEQRVRSPEDPPINLLYAVTSYCDPRTWPHFTKEGSLGVDDDPRLKITIGLHPKGAHRADEADLVKLDQLLLSPVVVALGEVGLDYSTGGEQDHRAQRRVLERLMDMADRHRLPVVLHTRDRGDGTASEDCLDILRLLLPQGHRIYRHCFTGSRRDAERWLQIFPLTWFGIGGAIFGHNMQDLVDAVQTLDPERLLLETDAPYMRPPQAPSPSGSRTRRPPNHPWLLGYVCQEVARIRGETTSQVWQASTRAARCLYRL